MSNTNQRGITAKNFMGYRKDKNMRHSCSKKKITWPKKKSPNIPSSILKFGLDFISKSAEERLSSHSVITVCIGNCRLTKLPLTLPVLTWKQTTDSGSSYVSFEDIEEITMLHWEMQRVPLHTLRQYLGNHNKAAGKPQLEHSSKKPMGECKRFPPPNYTAEEIQQWREARRRNFPSKSNMDKKLGEKNTNNGLDDDAKVRRQQLREILAKQAEMGIEVAELPPECLLESEYQSSQKKDLDSQGDEMEDGRRYKRRGRFWNKFDKRGNKHGRKNRWRPKKQRSGGDGSSIMAISNRKQPTLLQKLLSADIKRDKLRLLQAIRFMLLNSFFKGWPEKPLKFPLVIVKDEGTKDNVIIKEKFQYEGSGSVYVVDNSVSKGVKDQHYNQNTGDDDDNHEDEDTDDSDEAFTYEHGENGRSCKLAEESKRGGEITD